MKSTDENNPSMFYHVCEKFGSEVVNLVLNEFMNNFGVVETKEIFLERTKSGQTLLMAGAKNKLQEVFKILWNFIETNFKVEDQEKMLLTEDENGWNAFHYATHSTSEKLELVIKHYKQKLGAEKLKKIVEGENNKGENILHFAMRKEANESSAELL